MRWTLAAIVSAIACGGPAKHPPGCEPEGDGWMLCYGGELPFKGRPPTDYLCFGPMRLDADTTEWLCLVTG